MTQTIQRYSPAVIDKTGGTDNTHEPEAENMRLLALIMDDLNNLCEELNKLDYVIQKRNIEKMVYWRNKEKSK